MFNPDRVRAVYSGRKGCMCGCKGKYTYAKQFQAEATENRGYQVTDDEVNDRVVRQMVAKVEKFVREGQVDEVMVDSDWFAVDMENDRTYCVYFAD